MALHWDASFEIVLSLMEHYPDADVNAVGLEQLYQMIVSLPGFVDDMALFEESILEEVLREWYEEVNP